MKERDSGNFIFKVASVVKKFITDKLLRFVIDIIAWVLSNILGDGDDLVFTNIRINMSDKVGKRYDFRGDGGHYFILAAKK